MPEAGQTSENHCLLLTSDRVKDFPVVGVNMAHIEWEALFKGVLHTFGMTGSAAFSYYSDLFGFGQDEGI